MSFLRSFGVWAAFVLTPPLALFVYAQPTFRGPEYYEFFLPSLLIPAVGNVALWSLPLDTKTKGWLAGISLGLLLPIMGGFLWMRIFPGFESQPAILLGAFVLAGPSALGGGLAGTLRSRVAVSANR